MFTAGNKKIYLPGNQSEDWLCLWTQTKLFWETIDRIHFTSEFDLEQIYIYRNGMPVADFPISTNDDTCLYFNTISDLACTDNGHGISLTDYPNHFLMVFDLTSTQQLSHDFVHPELTNCSISIELKFLAALPNNIAIFIIGEKASTSFVDSASWVSKNHNVTN